MEVPYPLSSLISAGYRPKIIQEKGGFADEKQYGEAIGSTNARPPSKSAPHKNRHGSDITFFGIDLTPDKKTAAMVYFVQGVLGLARLAVSFYLKVDLHLDPAEVTYGWGKKKHLGADDLQPNKTPSKPHSHEL